MTLHSEILARKTYDTTDITNMIVDAYDILSLNAGVTLAENDNEDWDRIAKIYVLELLDRLRLERLAGSDSTVVVPPIMSDDVRRLIDKLILTPEDPENIMFVKYNTPIENWYDPSNPRS